MSKEIPASSSTKILGKRLKFSELDKNLISNALSFIWLKTNKKIEACRFNENNATVTYINNEGHAYFYLDELLFSDKVNWQI